MFTRARLQMSLAVAAAAGAQLVLQGCEPTRSADEVVYVCLEESGSLDRVVQGLSHVSEAYGYQFSEHGDEVKRSHQSLRTSSDFVPSGEPVWGYVEQQDGRGVLIVHNFGSVGEDLRFSLFYLPDDENARFRESVLFELQALDGVRLHRYFDGIAHSDPCVPS